MANIDIQFHSDIRAHVLAGLVLIFTTAQHTGANVEFLRGALALAQHQVLDLGLPWGVFLDDVREALAGDVRALLDVGVVVEGERA